jgi:hypothetical protein
MSFHTETTLAGYAREAVDLKTRMHEATGTLVFRQYLAEMFEPRADEPLQEFALDQIERLIGVPWQVGEPYVLAPAMTAIVAAAADALDLTGEKLPAEDAPTDHGVLFLPEPVYQRRLNGSLTCLGAITWTTMRVRASGQLGWLVCGWADLSDPHDPNAHRMRTELRHSPHLAASLGPYVLTDFIFVPIGEPVEPVYGPGPDPGVSDDTLDGSIGDAVDDADRTWQPALDNRYCLTDSPTRASAAVVLAYAFWRIQAQPLAVAAHPPLDRAARRRAQRASIVHTTRVVMLRRARGVEDTTAAPDEGQARWHYRVRFVVRGHWRHYRDPDGRVTKRIWIHAHIKGPDGAPLLGGEKVNILAR